MQLKKRESNELNHSDLDFVGNITSMTNNTKDIQLLVDDISDYEENISAKNLLSWGNII